MARIGIKRCYPGIPHISRYMAFKTVISSLHNTTETSGSTEVAFDTDSFLIGVDSHASRSLSNDKHHFKNYRPVHQNKIIEGVGGNLIIKGVGTIVWRIEDDAGQVHKIEIPNSFHVPNLQQCILSPQHWAQEARDHFPSDNGTFAVTQANAEILYWDQKRYKRTIPFDKTTNTPRFRSAAGASKYQAFEAIFNAAHHEKRYVCCRMDHRHSLRPQLIRTPEERPVEDNIAQYVSKSKQMKSIQDDIELTDRDNLQSELLQWHHRLGHLSFRTIKAMAMFNILPSRLKDCRIPMCATCKFGAMTRKPWRQKSKNNRIKVR